MLARSLTVTSGPISHKALFAATSFRSPGKARRLIRAALRRRSKLFALQSAAQVRSSNPRVTPKSVGGALRVSAQYLGRRLVEQSALSVSASPLFFQNPTQMITKTAATLAHERLADIASKETRYKITEQYSEGLTTFIPALISQMLSRRVKVENLTYRKVKLIISAIY